MTGIFLLALIAVAMGAVRPKLSDVFETHVKVEIVNGTHRIRGNGQFAVDVPQNKGLEHYFFATQRIRVFELQRYDLHEAFERDTKTRKCNKFGISGNMPEPWAWLANAQYSGQKKHGRFVVDFWSYNFTGSDGIRQELVLGAVNNAQEPPNRPVIFERHFVFRGTRQSRLIEFDEWHARAPPARVFDVPHDCQQ